MINVNIWLDGRDLLHAAVDNSQDLSVCVWGGGAENTVFDKHMFNLQRKLHSSLQLAHAVSPQ